MNNLLIATGNRGKIRELKKLLENEPLGLKTLNDFQGIHEVVETGGTFAENALLKAKGYARQTNCWALADDSGLEVEALGNAPGVFSARYAGAGSGDEENLAKLLKELEKIPNAERSARFVCVIAIADDRGEVRFVAEGVCPGTIAPEPRGAGGFGYDPVFVPENYKQTFAELPNSVKQKISHRAEALRKTIGFFEEIRAL